LLNRLLVICGLLAMMALVAHDLNVRRHGEASYKAAQTIAGGYVDNDGPQGPARLSTSMTPLVADPVARDDRLRADELDAGATWAKMHHAKSEADCPATSEVFRSGCLAAMRGEWPEAE
jgi:hypothetical protein